MKTIKYLSLILIILASVLVIGVNGCQEKTGFNETGTVEEIETAEPVEGWRDVELKDVLTGDTFKITDFKDKPVLLESFAVWCPTCRKQQDKIKGLHEEIGDDFVSISLDTDPNEDENKVIEYLNRTGFDWIYAISPSDVTQRLIDEFGVGVINAPTAPVVLICPGDEQRARLLKRGVKSPDELKASLATC